MAQFKSYIFEKRESPKKFPLGWMILGLLGIMLLNYTSEYNSFWIYMISMTGIFSLNWNNRYGAFKYGEKQDLNGYFTDEMIIDETGVKISNELYSIDKIKSITIVYDNVYGSKDWNGVEGNFTKNGEANLLILRLINSITIEKNFKLASLDHAKQLLELTESLRNKVVVNNDWKINYTE